MLRCIASKCDASCNAHISDLCKSGKNFCQVTIFIITAAAVVVVVVMVIIVTIIIIIIIIIIINIFIFIFIFFYYRTIDLPTQAKGQAEPHSDREAKASAGMEPRSTTWGFSRSNLTGLPCRHQEGREIYIVPESRGRTSSSFRKLVRLKTACLSINQK